MRASNLLIYLKNNKKKTKITTNKLIKVNKFNNKMQIKKKKIIMNTDIFKIRKISFVLDVMKKAISNYSAYNQKKKNFALFV